VYTARRPLTVTGLTTQTPLTRTETLNQTDWAIPTIMYPQWYMATAASRLSEAAVPTAYNSSTNATALLMGDFNMNDINTQANVNTWDNSNISINPTVNTVYWFGRQGTSAPTITVDSGLGFLPPTATRNETVTFSTSTMTGSNVPNGWTDVTYTFTGIFRNPGSATIQVR